ncbi:hypothetical protein BV20DRAFT_962227 [Pilatotrama ljubarskyi]|nr:hypothetical protein BV20DRAFT_962227 [Pilatotrama ljubarskyi]
MRCPWSVPIPANRPARVVANAEQLVILKALYARTGEDATKDDVAEVSRETGLQEKWIRKWIKRQRGGKRNKGKKASKAPVVDTPGQVPTLDDSPGVGCGTLDDATSHMASRLNASMRPVFDLHSEGPAWHSPLGQLASASASSTRDSPSSGSCASSFAAGTAAVQGSPPLHAALTVLPRSNAASGKESLTGTSQTTPPVQVVHPGASFTVPLRVETAQSSLYMIPPGEHPPSTGTASSTPGYYDDFSGSQSCHSPDLHPGLPGNRAHTSHLAPLHIPSGGYSMQPQVFNTPGSAPPSAFSPAVSSDYPGFPMGNSYFYRLLNESGDSAAPVEPPPFHSTYFLADYTRPPDVPPELWSPLPGFLSPVTLGDASGFGFPATPVSYQMRMTDLLALTRNMRALAAERPGGPSDISCPDADAQMAEGSLSATHGAGATGVNDSSPLSHSLDSEGAHGICDTSKIGHARRSGGATATPGSGEETDDDDEVVTPCEEVELFLPPDSHPAVATTEATAKAKEVYRGQVAIMDNTSDEPE